MANETVCAIGVKVLPSIPVKVHKGRYTIRIMISPKAAEVLILLDAVNTS